MRQEKMTLKTKTNSSIDLNNNQDFPDLGSNQKVSCNASGCNTKMNFAEITREKDKENSDLHSTKVGPGWVRIYRDKTSGKINYDPPREIESVNGLTEDGLRELKNMAIRWDNYRIVLNEMLGDESPFWNMKRLSDPLSDDDYESDIEEDTLSNCSDNEDELLYEDELI